MFLESYLFHIHSYLHVYVVEDDSTVFENLEMSKIL